MTEYWVSSAKHWCKFCQVWISGDRWNIQKHDQGRSHKERMEEYFKQKREDKRQGGLDDASLEKTLRQIEEAAVAAHADDLGGAGGGAGGGVGGGDGDMMSLAAQSLAPSSGEGGRGAAAAGRKRGREEGGDGEGGAGAADEVKEVGLYVVRGRVYLEGRFHEDKLVDGLRCETIMSENGAWVPARVLSHMEMAVQGTSVTFRRYRLEVPGPPPPPPPPSGGGGDAAGAGGEAGSEAGSEAQGAVVVLEILPRDIRIPVAPPPPPPPKETKKKKAVVEAAPVRKTHDEYEYDDTAAPAYGGWSTVPVVPVTAEEAERRALAADTSGNAKRAQAADGDAYSTFNPFGGAYRGVRIEGAAPVTAAEVQQEALEAAAAAMEEVAAARGVGSGVGAGAGAGVKLKKRKKRAEKGKKKSFRSKEKEDE
jgi:WW domain-binding protein 4